MGEGEPMYNLEVSILLQLEKNQEKILLAQP
jgi:hypothetical protein